MQRAMQSARAKSSKATAQQHSTTLVRQPMYTMLFLLANFCVLSPGMLQYARELCNPLYAQEVVDTNGDALLRDPRFAHVNGYIGYPDILSEIDCARRKLLILLIIEL
jgi:hypothetical protein